MVLAWLAPNITGGCPITSYSIYKETTPGSYVSVDPELVNNLIELRKYTLTFPAEDIGKTFNFYVTAANELGSVASPIFSFTLAAVPDQPTTVPKLNL